MASSEQDKQLRAQLAQGLGYFPASLAAEDVARYREHTAERKAREEAGDRDGWGPGGYMWRKWDHLKEERRRTEVETPSIGRLPAPRPSPGATTCTCRNSAVHTATVV